MKYSYIFASYSNVPTKASNIKTKMYLEEGRLFLDGVPYSGTLQCANEEPFSEKNYVDGNLHGIQKKFYQSGQLKEVVLYNNGEKSGRRIMYYKCGSKKWSASYFNGHLDGIVEEWAQSGFLTARKTYYLGKLISGKNFLM